MTYLQEKNYVDIKNVKQMSFDEIRIRHFALFITTYCHLSNSPTKVKILHFREN